jgi:tRNA(His) guanylyltransferase
MNDDLGDRMKEYEGKTEVCLMPMLPTFARVDGRSFHSFTRGMNRPYDERMSMVMTETARWLAQETNARMTYTQSDEITLAWLSTNRKSQIWFDGRHSKMVSQIAALATLIFYRLCAKTMPEYADRLPSFDARVWQVPNVSEGANVFLWREWDATKNSITMAASSVYSHKTLHGKNGSEKQEMLWQKGINWNDYPAFFKRGTYIQRRTVIKPFSVEEIDKLPAKHEARINPDLIVERSEWAVLDMPPLSQIANREAVIFEGAEPVKAMDATIKQDPARQEFKARIRKDVSGEMVCFKLGSMVRVKKSLYGLGWNIRPIDAEGPTLVCVPESFIDFSNSTDKTQSTQ